MNERPLGTAALVLGLLSLAVAAPAAADNCRFPHAPGELLVKFRSDDGARRRAWHTDLKVRTARAVGRGGVEHWRLDEAADLGPILARLHRDPAVAYAECNLLRRPLRRPDDPLYDRQWALENSGQAIAHPRLGVISGTPGADMALPDAWELSTGSRQVVVAVLDDAVDIDHPDLADNIWANPGEVPDNGLDDDGNGFVDDVHGWDFKGRDNDPRPGAADEGHGTAVAGVVGALGDNGQGIAGVAWRVSIMPLRFAFTVASEIEAVDYAIANGAHVLNASFGGTGRSQAEAEAMDRLQQAGILVVTAAGNEHGDNDLLPAYPASFPNPNILTLAASDLDDRLTPWSQFGQTSVDTAAPGVAIFTTQSPGASRQTGDSGAAGVFYDFIGGTSFAVPNASGVAALIKALHPGAGFRELKGRILAGAEPLAGEARGLLAVDGRVDAFKALSLAPQPVVVIAGVTLEDGNNGLPDPGETATLAVDLENLWTGAGAVNAVLSTTAAGVTVTGAVAGLADLPEGAVRRLRFTVRFADDLQGHRRLPLRLDLTGNGGLAVSRRFQLEAGVLENGVGIDARIQTNDQDDVQFYHLEVPAGAGNLRFDIAAFSDLDLLVKFGERPDFDLACYELVQCRGAGVLVSAGPGGNESLTVAAPQAGTWHVAVINFRSIAFDVNDLGLTEPVAYQIRAGYAVPGGGGGGGAALWLAGLLLAALGWRRWRRRPRCSAKPSA